MELKIKVVTGPRELPVERTVEEGTTLERLAKEYKDRPYTIIAARVDNKISELTKKIEHSPAIQTIELLDLRDIAALRIYQRSISLLYLKAVYDVLGKVPVLIENTLNKGLYTEVRTQSPVTRHQIRQVEQRMHELVEKDIPFIKEILNREDTLKVLIEDGLAEKVRMLEKSEVDRFPFYSLEGFRNFFYGMMVPSTGYLNYFELRKYRRGVLVRCPDSSAPNRLPPFVDEALLYKVYGETTKWDRLMGISYVVDLNEKIESGEYREIIQICEALHEKKIAQIADMITKQKKRIVLISGPSSSGKTTFARRLNIQLRVNGLEPIYLGTDDYFVERHETPKDEYGEPNFEDLESLDIELFNRDMNRLLSGDEVDLPTFDFLKGTKVFGNRVTRAKKGQPIIVEGIHGLNRLLTQKIPDGEKFKIYISPLTQLNIDEHNRIPTTDARMLRRLVRDYRFRGHTARSTISAWPKVRKGEDKNIFPFNGEADVFFNSVHIYELAVLKKYADPLLRQITREEPEYSEAVRMLKFLQYFKTIDDDSMIVNNSIIREFIGGSIFV